MILGQVQMHQGPINIWLMRHGPSQQMKDLTNFKIYQRVIHCSSAPGQAPMKHHRSSRWKSLPAAVTTRKPNQTLHRHHLILIISNMPTIFSNSRSNIKIDNKRPRTLETQSKINSQIRKFKALGIGALNLLLKLYILTTRIEEERKARDSPWSEISNMGTTNSGIYSNPFFWFISNLSPSL